MKRTTQTLPPQLQRPRPQLLYPPPQQRSRSELQHSYWRSPARYTGAPQVGLQEDAALASHHAAGAEMQREREELWSTVGSLRT